MFQNPTGHSIRSDGAGDGRWKARRGGRFHAGEDYNALPGQDVVAPCDGIFTRIGQVYESDPRWSLVEISYHGLFKVKLFYVTGRVDLVVLG